MRSVWLILGMVAVGLGVLGVVLPVLPTTPFMLLAAGCFAKSSPRLHDWLIGHRLFGPPIRDWQAHGAIAPGAKRAAVLAMLAVFALSLILQVKPWVLAVQALALGGAASFILTRPSGPRRP